MSLTQESELLRLRKEKLNYWKSQAIDPFGGPYPDTQPIETIITSFVENLSVRIAGRILSIRDMGKSFFAHIQDQSAKMQIYANPQSVGQEAFQQLKHLDLGDIIGVAGECFLTKTKEKTVRVKSWQLLAKSLRPLPSKWHGLHDVEARYRQRYLDLIMNPEVKKVFFNRSQIIKEIRHFLHQKGFIEVETPMMQTVAGGAAANPFKTFHEALGIPLYLRIAPELYLKRLLVGGFEKVFELNRNFRNEGISRKHNPEFTMLEAYCAYGDYRSMAQLLEELIVHVAQRVFGTLQFPASKHLGENKIVDLTPPWPQKPFREVLSEAIGKDWFTLDEAEKRKVAEEFEIEVKEEYTESDIAKHLFEKLVEARTIGPLFVTELPADLVPLARQNKVKPEFVDVFELIVNGQELAPGYSELNDPIVQRERLEKQVGEEKQKIDEEFLLALEYGMPPAGGIGMGIDRLTMLFTGQESIRDVILFPLLRPKEEK
ncbi:lysyl-tRNA synthetase [Methylacidiphilum kamchatkense Kam1]|uniref:Lysine--tRNA ligase n=1 Tax=Methylacidiphilum kamchatkense Kam1 TaxID=1202785 RepID=A0A0C1UT65_9BACT|nr:lysine--tRNA ligase [Methylacidiphilum kamchatkense]KIE59489.1 lysyl-tRNA synthetase [Methylacidiphilum kamchatkense Kam1]QDQ42510.1 lysyl-tRNA synthetase class II [Methylacidiphilum kamchatkense Kam1]